MYNIKQAQFAWNCGKGFLWDKYIKKVLGRVLG
jgi:hypothetical protein